VFRFFKKRALQESQEAIVQEVDYSDASDIANYIQKKTGIEFVTKSSVLHNKLTLFCKRKGIFTFNELLTTLQDDANLEQELINLLTTNETYFNREYAQVEEFVKKIQHTASKEVKILCAPCATGEEPCSIAIALLEADITNFSIVAIDINSQAIIKAKEGIYTQRHVDRLTPKILQKYFQKIDNSYKISDAIKSYITYKQANIFDEDFKKLGKFDSIFSRNMLIYFNQKERYRAKEILEHLLRDKSQTIYFGHADFL